MKLDTQYAIERTMELLDVDSPTGYTRDVGQTLMERLREMGFTPVRTRKGLRGLPAGRAGASPHACRACGHAGPDGAADQAGWRLAFTTLGGPSLQAVETENVTVITREGKRYTGVVELKNASKHVNRELDAEARSDATLEILLDEEVSNQQAVQDLGIAVGDVVCLEPRRRRYAQRVYPQPLLGG